jgi:hypothetical protein
MASESKSSFFRLLEAILAVVGGSVGAILGAVMGARTSVEIGRDLLQSEVANKRSADLIVEPSIQAHPFTRELFFPPKPAPDWSDSKPATLPKPTYAPVSVAFGLMLGAAGVVTSFWVSVAGLIVFILGLANWIGDLVHEQH